MMSSFDWRREAVHWLVLAIMFGVAVATWSTAPERIPIHWNLAGEVDRWAGRAQGLLLLPLVAAAAYLLLRLLPLVDPGRVNYANFATAYDTLRLAILVVLAAIYGAMHAALRGADWGPPVVAPVAVGGLLLLVGNLAGKIRPNWFVGIRTPWTLSSARSWTRTHRLGGWVFVVWGVLVMASPSLPALHAAMPWVVVGGTLLLFVYSYLVWRGDSEKQPPAGRLPA